MQNNSNSQYLLSKLLVLVLYGCHGNLWFHFSILQSVFVGLKVNKNYEILQTCIISSYFFLALLKLAFISEIFYCKSLLIVFGLDLLFFSFFLSTVYWLGFVFYPFCAFSELLFSQSFSAVPRLLFGNEKFPAQLFHLCLIFTCWFFFIFPFLKR